MKANISFWLLATIALITGSVQAQVKVYSVGLVSLGSTVTAEINGLRDGLKEAGYIVGTNLLLNVGLAKGYEGLRPVVQSYVEKKFDVIVSTGTSASLVAKEITQHIPIVFIGGPTRYKQDWLSQWRGRKEISLASRVTETLKSMASGWRYSRKLCRVCEG